MGQNLIASITHVNVGDVVAIIVLLAFFWLDYAQRHGEWILGEGEVAPPTVEDRGLGGGGGRGGRKPSSCLSC
ncbi:hypothetical protein NGA_0497520 [Nannochloropsis gaditana CCMP526]|uniref:uncharacterized protein n=1 Tax=Nannochloropsis gaditana (strain CCMP526) TaxID=1093141 RepID=UPI00029F8036|nr:hypothetical protein NGA_0497520 [Nannochloropsis gaditana CCMP526]EKU20178.1 hypothetical protein NGA_0497520 [Nannochloropsis gaditana CCMP526]|eukprot:XP_005856198.1 hypothetical protein NGA_0497520 [Nannochloropsis gaditana CCMP526]